MESLGVKLKEAREAKGLTFDEISRDTNIAVRYLEGLEKEDFAIFPGEPYILGFLRNYGEALGLDSRELISLYRALRIQEQPVPVEALLKQPSPAPRIIGIALAALAVLGAVAGGAYFFITRRGDDRTPRQIEAHAPAEYRMNTPLLERRLYVGDTVLVPLGEQQYKVTMDSLGDALTLGSPSGPLMMDLTQESRLDLNADGQNDLAITAADFQRNNADAGALLRFKLIEAPAAGNAAAAVLPAENMPALTNTTTVLGPSVSAYPFTLQLSFQGYCMLRWEILHERDRPGRNEELFQRGRELSIPAQNGIRFWISNARAVKAVVTGGGRTVPLELGAPGEVVVADLRWVRGNDGQYSLVLGRLE